MHMFTCMHKYMYVYICQSLIFVNDMEIRLCVFVYMCAKAQ